MAEFVPGFNQLSFDPNSFAGSSQISGDMKSFSNLKFNALFGGETKTLIMKNYHDIGTRLSYVVLSTDDSLDPDKATELTTILEYELQENEFLVSVELHGRNPTAQVGNMHQIFIKNLRSWDFYSSKDGDKDPREVRVCFSAAKEPVIKSFTFSTSGRDKGLESFIWNGTKYSCDSTELYQTPFILYQPSLALKYKHDNIAYTMDDAANVKTTGKQKISGLKIFAQQPEVTAEPSKDTHLVTKGYFDKFLDSYMGTAKKRDLSLSIISQADASNLEFYHNIYTISFSKFKVLLSDGRRLDPLYIERMSDSLDKNLTRKRVVLTVNLQDQEDPQPTSKTKEEMDAYQLQDGEFFATFISGYELKNIDNYFFKPRWDDIHPWDDYYEPASHSYWTDTPLVAFKLIVHDIDLNISKCSFETGSGTKLSKYYAAELSDGVAQSVFKEYKTPQAGTLVFDFGGLSKFVNVNSDQVINGVKTFSETPKSLGKATEDTDLVTLAYVKNKFAAKASNGDVTIQLDGKFNNTWMGFSELKVLLQNGKRLEPKFLEKVTVQGYTDSVLMVFGINDDPDAAVVRPADKTRQEIEKYVLGENEFLAELTYSEGLGKAKGHGYERQSCPWDSFLVNGLSQNEVAPMFKLVIKGLTYELKGIKFTTGDKYNTYQYKCTMYSAFFGLNNGPSKVVETSDIQSEITLEVPSGTLVSSASDSGYVDLANAQIINGVKTFAKAPQSTIAPLNDADLVNKKYIDESINGIIDGLSSDGTDTVTGLVKGSNNAGSYCGFSYFKWLLKDGTRLDLKMVENVAAASATDPVLAVWHVVKDLGAQITAPEKKTKQEVQDYQLQEGEFKGTLSYFKVVGKYGSYTGEPWDSYIGSGITGQHEGLLGFTIEKLNIPFKGITFTVGNKGESWSYNFHTLQFTGTVGKKPFDVNYGKTAVNNEVVEVDLPSDTSSNKVPAVVTIKTEQAIAGKKVFTGGVQSSLVPVAGTDLVNKDYVDNKFLPAPANLDFKIDITCEGNSSYVAYSELKINLTGGKVIEPLYLEKREAKPDNNIYRFVYKISDASGVTVKQTPRKTSSEMDAYQLQEGEYIGHLYYAGHFNGECSMNAYDNQTDPWYGYLFSKGSGKLTMCQIILSGLPIDVTGIQFKAGDKHNSFGYKSTKYGAKFTYGAKAQEHELANAQATHEFLADYNVIGQEPITNCFMELVGDQLAKGVKTFAKPPKSSQAPAEDNDLTNKKYVDDELAKLVARIAALEAAKP